MPVSIKMRRTEAKVEIRIGSKHPKLYLVPKEKSRSVESLLSEYLAERESTSLDETFRELNDKYSKQGNVLCGLRLKKGWTQTELARKVETSQANIAAIENGRRKIGKTFAQRLAVVLETDYQVFL